MNQLFTYHDKFNIHKSLGFLCLFHYFVRIYWLMIYGTMFFDRDYVSTWITPVLHLSLSLSSLTFPVPKYRFDSKIIIWKELQLHNIVFTSRSATIFLYWLVFNVFDKYDSLYPFHVMIRLLIITIHHYTADEITHHFNVNNRTTTRDINWENIPSVVQINAKRFYAFSQIFAINALILGECDTTGRGFLESAFLIMFPIQLSTFLMTLVRKSIISNKTWHLLYSISLMTPYLITLNRQKKDNVKPLLSLIFIILRFNFNVNKYILMHIVVYLYLYLVFRTKYIVKWM